MLELFQKIPVWQQIAVVFTWLAPSLFSAGVHFATIRFLSKEIKDVKTVQKDHGEELVKHGEAIATLEERTR